MYWFLLGIAVSIAAAFIVAFAISIVEDRARHAAREETRDIRETLRTFKGSLVHLEGRVTKLEKQIEKA